MNRNAMFDADTSAQRGPISRRWLLGASGGALLTAGLAAGCTQQGKDESGQTGSGEGLEGKRGQQRADGPSGVLGANFNEDPRDVTFPALEGLSASWLRGFVVMKAKELDKGGSAAGQAAVKTLLEAHGKGYGTILALKFQYKHHDLPAPNSPEMKAELARVDRVLDAVLDKVDILTIGNEPFLETQHKDRKKKLNAFYEKVAHHVLAYRRKHFPSGCRTRLYMGALNHLDWKGGQTPATDRWMTFVRRTPGIEGVDIHPHVDAPEGVDVYLKYVRERLGEKKFLVTEFSLVLLYKNHLGDEVPDPLSNDYSSVRELLRDAPHNRLSPEEWHTFLSKSPWFESHKHFLRNAVQKFRRTGKLAVATYGVAQAKAMEKVPDGKPPWILNSLYANRTVQHEDGRLPHNYTVFDDFRALQRPQDERPVRTGRTHT